MEFRKVINFGKTSYVVSLPKKWITSNNIQKGDVVSLDIGEDTILISPGTESKEKIDSIDIDITKLNPMIKRTIASLYKGGFDEIRIKFNSTEELKDVQKVIKNTCIGFEIVEQKSNLIIARKISDAINDEFDSMLRRSFLFLKSMAEESKSAIEVGDNAALSNVSLSDYNINKFTDFCRRILNKKGHPRFKKIAPIYYIIEELEKVGDNYNDICRYVVENNVKVKSKDLLELYEGINNFYTLFYELFYKLELEKLRSLGLMKKDLDKKIKKLIPKTNKSESEVLYNLRVILERVFDMNGALIAGIYGN